MRFIIIANPPNLLLQGEKVSANFMGSCFSPDAFSPFFEKGARGIKKPVLVREIINPLEVANRREEIS